MLLTKSIRASASFADMSAEQVRSWWNTWLPTGGDERVTRSSAETLSPIAAAHRILTNSFGLIPFGIYQKQGNGRIAISDPVLDPVLKVRPTEMMSPLVLRKIVMSNAFWEGFGAVWNRRDNLGRVVERIPLPTDCCQIHQDSETGQYWYEYTVNGETRTFSPWELSILFFETYDGIHGRGIKTLAREAIAADGMAQRHNKKFYQNGARVGGIVEVDTDAKPETRSAIRRQFQAFASDDAFKVAVLDHGMKYTQLGLNQKDAQYIESRSFTVEEVARFTGIPRFMLQTGNESYNSNAQQRVSYVTDVLVPFVTAWELEDTYKVLSQQQREKDWYMKGNVSVLLRGDDQSRAEFYTKMIATSVYNPDECRALEERDPIPGGMGQQFLVTKNLGSLESVLKGES